MESQKRAFQLPMTMTILISRQAEKVVAHALDFDIVTVADTEEHATNKLALAVKTYVEYGLSKGWSEDIMFAAPNEYWEGLSPETPVNLMAPIFVDDKRMLVVRAAPKTTHEPGRVACPA